MTTTTQIENNGRTVDVLISQGLTFAKVTVIEKGRAQIEMFTADELRELAEALDNLEHDIAIDGNMLEGGV